MLTPLPNRARGGVRGGSSTLIYAVGPAGVKLLARQGLRLRRIGIPSDRFIRHTLAVTSVLVDLHVADAGSVLELIQVQQEPAAHRAFLGPFGSQWVKPDLFARIGAGTLEDRWFIEVDLATEHAGTLKTRNERYLAHLTAATNSRRTAPTRGCCGPSPMIVAPRSWRRSCGGCQRERTACSRSAGWARSLPSSRRRRQREEVHHGL